MNLYARHISRDGSEYGMAVDSWQLVPPEEGNPSTVLLHGANGVTGSVVSGHLYIMSESGRTVANYTLNGAGPSGVHLSSRE